VDDFDPNYEEIKHAPSTTSTSESSCKRSCRRKENTVQKKWYEQSEANFTALQSVLQLLQDGNVVPTTLPSLVAKEEHHMER